MISILGCGWLGLPTATKLNSNFNIKGSTTSENKINILKNNKITPYIIDLFQENRNIAEFLDAEILIINIPIINKEGLLEGFFKLRDEIIKSPIKKILFISSTSVYKENNCDVTEGGEINQSNLNFTIEELLKSLPKHFHLTILRMGGLIGPRRHPGKFFANRKDLITKGLNPVNLIHLEDCTEIISEIILRDIWDETFNVCYPHHPTREELYTKATIAYCGIAPKFVEEKGQWKTVNPEKLIKKLGYSFKYTDLFEAINHC